MNGPRRILPRPAVVASLAPRDLSDARRLFSLVPAGATAIEVRLDLPSPWLEPAALLALDPRPLILTLRSAAEGGAFAGPPEEYGRRLVEAYGSGATVDVEYARNLLSDASMLPDRERVVVSQHSLFTVPQDPDSLISAMLATGARAVKLVCGAAELATSLQLAAVQQRQRDRSVAVLPMGPASAPGRILSALAGASLVYGPVEALTAPGQVPLSELLDVYRVGEPRRIERLFGIVGSEVSGSLSPLLHNEIFRSRGLPWLYLPLPVSDFGRTRPHEVEIDPAFSGLSVTHPWKREAARVGVPSEDVRAAGAANTLVRGRSGWRAENTDVDGVFEPLADHDTGEGRSAVVLGAGGAGRAAVLAARKLGYEVLLASRRDEVADAAARELGVDSLAATDLERAEADLYVNATPIGSRSGDPPAFPAVLLESRPLVFDCVYRRDGTPTSTIVAARAARCPTVDGLQMFAAQAVRQAGLFGVPDVGLDEVRNILRRAR